jgi:hypothetical protein
MFSLAHMTRKLNMEHFLFYNFPIVCDLLKLLGLIRSLPFRTAVRLGGLGL